LKILQVTPYFPPDHWGGIEIHVLELSKYLSKDYEVTILTSGKNAEKRQRSKNLQVIRLPGIEIPGVPGILPKIENPIVFDIDSAIKEVDNIDLIHVHGQEYAISYEAIKMATRKGIPSVITIHNTGEALAQYFAIRFLRRILDKTAFRYSIDHADAVIAINQSTLNYLTKYHPKRTYIIPNGIDLERFKNIKKSSDYVLFVGRLDALKGPEYFVRAIPLVLRKIDTRFLIVGTGPQERTLKNLSRNLGINRYLQFRKNVSYFELPRIVARASVLVAPYNAGYTLLEAAAAETPIVSARHSWNMEYIREFALYVEPRNVKEIANAIIRVIEDSNLAKELTHGAKKYVEENRDWKKICPRVIEVYQKVSASSSSQRSYKNGVAA